MQDVLVAEDEPSWQLIVQLPTAGDVQDVEVVQDLDVAIQAAFESEDIGGVDGHDIGRGTMNIFGYVRPSRWSRAIELTETILAEREVLEQAVIARRDLNDENERHDVVRPAGYIGEFEY